MRLLAGRGFADDERSAVVISESLADALAGRSIGARTAAARVGRRAAARRHRHRHRRGRHSRPRRRWRTCRWRRMRRRFLVLTVRARDAAAGRDAVRAALRAADPAVPRDRIMALDRKTTDASRGFESSIALASAIAGLALVLAAAGLFAMLAFTVRRRRREIGIRVAVGASRGRRDVDGAAPGLVAGGDRMCGRSVAGAWASAMWREASHLRRVAAGGDVAAAVRGSAAVDCRCWRACRPRGGPCASIRP